MRVSSSVRPVGGCAVSMARLVVTSSLWRAARRAGGARLRGVSTVVNVLVGRYRRDGESALEPLSRRSPQEPAPGAGARSRSSSSKLRKGLAEQGLAAGAETIAYHLRRRHGDAPAVSTIWRELVVDPGRDDQRQAKGA